MMRRGRRKTDLDLLFFGTIGACESDRVTCATETAAHRDEIGILLAWERFLAA